MTLKRPCLVCGIPTTSTRCERHRKPGHHTYTETTTERGLGTAHRRIAKRVLAEERTCWLCGRGPTTDDPLEADHIVPRSKGGRTVRWNYHAAHRSCNRSRGDRMVGEPPTEPEDDTSYAVPWRGAPGGVGAPRDMVQGRTPTPGALALCAGLEVFVVSAAPGLVFLRLEPSADSLCRIPCHTPHVGRMDEKDVVAGRFSRRFTFYDEPEAIEQLERVAAAHSRSVSAEIRSAIRKSLEEERP